VVFRLLLFNRGRIRGERASERASTEVMELLRIPPSLPILGGRVFPLLRQYRLYGTHHPLTWSSLQTTGRKHNLNGGRSAQCAASHDGASVSHVNGAPKDSPLLDSLLRHARILYCASPAMGHNKASYLQCFAAFTSSSQVLYI